MKCYAPMLLMLVLTGCHTTRWVCGAGMAPHEPLVALESVTEVQGSPGRGYPVSQYPMPIFPREMLRAGIAGEVTLRIAVNKTGVVEQATVVHSTQPEFEAPALIAAKQWRFVEFLDPGASDRSGMLVDCRIRFGFIEE